MALTREQYENIMRDYSEKQARSRHILAEHRARVRAALPEYEALEKETGALGLASLRRALGTGSAPDETAPAGTADDGNRSGDAAGSPDRSSVAASAAAEFSRIAARRKELLRSGGFPEDYLEPICECPLCRDTGYLPDGSKCDCFRRKETEILYDQSHIRGRLASENFDMLSEQWYTGEDLLRFRKAAAASKRFVAEFDKVHRSLYFFGTVGTGKTFLSDCIAGELLRRGHSVIYFSAITLFEKLSSCSYDYRLRSELESLRNELYDCELLIIDDLGTEVPGSFVTSSLFSLMNERLLRDRSTVISTNLSLDELQSRYSDRILSRIMSRYESYKLTGWDIRLQQKQANRANNDR